MKHPSYDRTQRCCGQMSNNTWPPGVVERYCSAKVMLIVAVMRVTVLINEGGPFSRNPTTLSVMEQSSFTKMMTMTTSAKAPF